MKRNIFALLGLFLLFGSFICAQQPSPTPTIYSEQTLTEMKRLQQAALTSDYALKQVEHLTNNIGP